MNNFVDVLIALNTLSNENSTNEKVVLLKEYCKSELFKKVCVAALTTRFNYHMTKLPEVPMYEILEDKKDQDIIFNALESLTNSTGAGNQEKLDLANAASRNIYCYEVVKRIVKKDLKCGASKKLINKACPGLLHEWPYMRCHSFNEKNMSRIKYPAQVEEKCDGTHVDILVKNGKISFMSRRGRPMEFHGMLDSYFDFNIDPIIFVGEAEVVDSNGKLCDRKTGNGIINKAIKNTITKEEASRVILTLWDAIPYDQFIAGQCDIPQIARFTKLNDCFYYENFNKVMIVQNKKIMNEKQAMGFYKKIRKAGGEGAILKNFNGGFKNHTSPNQVKIKADFEADFEVIDWKYGDKGSKYEDCLGAIQVSSSDKKVISWVGSGFNDEDRYKFASGKLLGKIVTIKFESLIDRKTNSGLSLFLPRICDVRIDKIEADDLDYLKELTSC